MKHPSLFARACGMGLFLAWIVGFAFVNEISGSQLVEHGPEIEKYVPVAANIITLLLLTANHRQLCGLAKRRGILLLTGICAVLSPVIIVIALRAFSSVALFSFGMVLRGIAAALLFMEWNELFARLPFRFAGVCYSGAYVLSVMVQMLMGIVPREFAFVVEVLCAAGATVMLPLSLKIRHPVPSDDLQERHDTAWTFPVRLTVLVAVYTVTAFFLRQLSDCDISIIGRCGGGIIALLSLVGCAFFFDKRFDASLLEIIALPLTIASVLIYCLFGAQASVLVLVLSDAGNVAFRIFILVMMCNLCFRYQIPALWLFGVVRIVMIAAEGCGLALGSYGMLFEDPGHEQILQAILYSFILLLVIASTTTQQMRTLVGTSWRIFPKQTPGESYSERLSAVMSTSELLLWRCSQVARLYGLTQREEEVLGKLVEGSTNREIEEELVVSESTVRTHIRHIYSKLGVHSRKEVEKIVKDI